MLWALGSAGGTICYGRWVVRLMISYTRQGGTICYGHWVYTRDQGYDLLRAASCDITHETGGTVCYGHWILILVISHTRQEVRFITGSVLRYHTRDRGFGLLRALDFASCDITHDLCRALGSAADPRLVISHTRQEKRIFGVGFCFL